VNEIQDLKNYILSIQDKLDNLTMMLQNYNEKHDTLNEIINLLYNQGFEKTRVEIELFKKCPENNLELRK
jgi:hypothetical protein